MNKLEPKEHFHGSDLEKIEEIYGIPKENIISFSANVNPLGISYDLRKELPKHLDAITRYPDREYTSLRKCIGEYVHTDYENILVGNGSTELISLVAQIMQPKNASGASEVNLSVKTIVSNFSQFSKAREPT